MSNYMLQLQRAKEGFLTYDQKAMVTAFSLEQDSFYLYLPFLGQRHRIQRTTGDVSVLVDGVWQTASFNAHLSIFDTICRPQPGTCSGRWSALNHLKGMVHPGVSEEGMYRGYLPVFTGKRALLQQVAAQLPPFPVGDIAFVYPIFPFLPLVFQYWEEDDEFPCQLRILWEENILEFVTYETMWYIAAAFFQRLTELMEQAEQDCLQIPAESDS